MASAMKIVSILIINIFVLHHYESLEKSVHKSFSGI